MTFYAQVPEPRLQQGLLNGAAALSGNPGSGVSSRLVAWLYPVGYLLLDCGLILIDISAKWTGNDFVKFVFLLIEGQEDKKETNAVVPMSLTKESRRFPVFLCHQGTWCCLWSPVHQRLSPAWALAGVQLHGAGRGLRVWKCISNPLFCHTPREAESKSRREPFQPLESFLPPWLGLCQHPLSLLKMLFLRE